MRIASSRAAALVCAAALSVAAGVAGSALPAPAQSASVHCANPSARQGCTQNGISVQDNPNAQYLIRPNVMPSYDDPSRAIADCGGSLKTVLDAASGGVVWNVAVTGPNSSQARTYMTIPGSAPITRAHDVVEWVIAHDSGNTGAYVCLQPSLRGGPFYFSNYFVSGDGQSQFRQYLQDWQLGAFAYVNTPPPIAAPTPGYPSADMAAEKTICAAAGQRLVSMDPMWATLMHSQMDTQVFSPAQLQAAASASPAPNLSSSAQLAFALERNMAAHILDWETAQAFWREGDPKFASGGNGMYMCEGWARNQSRSGRYGIPVQVYGYEPEMLHQMDDMYKTIGVDAAAYQQAVAAAKAAAPTPAPVAHATPQPVWGGLPVTAPVNPRARWGGNPWAAYRHDCVPAHAVPAGWTKNCIDTDGYFIADNVNRVYWVVAPSNVRRNGDGSLTFFGRTVSRGTLVFKSGYYFAIPVRSVSAASIASGNLGAVDKIAAPSGTFYVESALVHAVSDGRGGISKTVFAIVTPAGDVWRVDVSGTSNVIAAGGANVIAAGGANVIAAGGANVIAAGGANVIAAGGANVIAAGGANVLYAAGVIAAGGANVIAAGGAN